MNPMARARQTLADALTGIGAPVFTYPPAQVPGQCVVIVNGTPAMTARGHVTLEAHILGLAGGDHPSSIAAVEQLAYDTQQAVAGAGLGWADLGFTGLDTATGTLKFVLTITLRDC